MIKPKKSIITNKIMLRPQLIFKSIEYLEYLMMTRQIQRNYPVFNLNNLKKYKKSDTIFILGSSPSILSMDRFQWSEIESHDSMALNKFAFHQHIPTFYWMEFSAAHLYPYHFLFSEIKNKYYSQNVQFILNYSNFVRSSFDFGKIPGIISDKCNFLLPRFLFSEKQSSLESVCRKLIVELYQNKLTYRSFFHSRASLSTCVQICWALGYKNICLPGVDLKDQHYFYEKLDNLNAREFAKSDLIIQKYHIKDYDRDKSHRTESQIISSKSGLLPVSLILKLLQENLLMSTKSQIFSYSQYSGLSEHFPVWKEF